MGVSSRIGSGLQPGVCLSTDRPDDPFEGQVIYETDTNRTLVWDNSAWLVIADNQVLSIDSTNGRVGVGTTSPAASLTVTSGTDDAKVKIDSNGGSVGTIDSTANTNDATARWLSLNPSGGNVGIGNTAPAAKLDVTGSVRANDQIAVLGTAPRIDVRETTTTGDPRVWLGQNGTDGEGLNIWYQSSSGDSYLDNIFYLGDLYLRTNNGSSVGIRIDEAGRVFMPNRVAFSAVNNGLTNPTGVVAMNAVGINTGGGYNTSGRFTAPVAGNYMFVFNAFADQSSGAPISYELRKNGNASSYRSYTNLPPGGYYLATSGVSGLFPLAANDYVEVFLTAGTLHGNAAAMFSGWLIS